MLKKEPYVVLCVEIRVVVLLRMCSSKSMQGREDGFARWQEQRDFFVRTVVVYRGYVLAYLERKHHPCVLPFPRVMPVESPVSSAVVICVEIRAAVLCVEVRACKGWKTDSHGGKSSGAFFFER